MQKQLSEGFFRKNFMRNFPEFTIKHLRHNLFFDKLKLCRCAASLKSSLYSRCFLVKFAKFVGIHFLQSGTRRLLLIVAASIVVKEELANKTVNYQKGQCN